MASVYAKEKEAAQTSIVMDKTKRYQTIDGFGAAWLFSEKLTDQQLNTFDMLFSREKGIALSFLRQPITLMTRTLFSIAHDRQYIIPMIKKALSLNPDLKVMMSLDEIQQEHDRP
ncbi:carbohydrate-binding_protein [Hexamita inflata]|uniref:Carbohydrate-binding_protein n=1 Tax=Hexamita inflata TaxID=28002 RepID=A0ABP1GDX5_9EUKA